MSLRSTVKFPVRYGTSIRMMSDSSNLRVFANYAIYKGKCALNVKPIAPTFTTGANGKSKTVTKSGALFFEFAPSTGQPREYDWTKKATFSLSVTELGEIVRLKDGTTADFVHDPNAGSKLIILLVYFQINRIWYLFKVFLTKMQTLFLSLVASESGKLSKRMKWTPTTDSKGE